MIIDQKILDDLSAQAMASPRLRMNMDLRNSPSDGSQRMLNVECDRWHSLVCLESRSVRFKAKDGANVRMGEEDILKL